MTLTKKDIDALIRLIRVEVDEALEERIEPLERIHPGGRHIAPAVA